MEEKERSYIAFISYRHMPLDKEAAERIQKKIENYTVPKEYREKFGGKKLGHVFRDEDELPASSSLTDSIYYALDHSEFLIVICTPDLPKSKWCEAEIKYFLKTHDRDHILAVLADGTPEESFSPYLLHDFDEEGNPISDIEPLAANIAGENHTINKKTFNKETTRICAALIGCPFDSLWQRERRARTNRLLTAAAAAVAVMAVFLGVVLNRNAQIAAQSAQIQSQNDQITAQNDELTQKNDEIQKQNDQIKEQYDQIEAQNTTLQQQLSTALVDSGFARLDNYDRAGALTDAVFALENEDPDVYDHRVKQLLSDALGAYTANRFQTTVACELPSKIRSVTISEDQSRLYLLDYSGVLRCLNAKNYEILWESNASGSNSYTRIYPDVPGGLVLCKTSYELFAVSAENGERRWTYTCTDRNRFQALSADGKTFALLDCEKLYSDSAFVLFLNTADGTEKGRTPIADEEFSVGSLSYTNYCAFSPDGKDCYCYIDLETESGTGSRLLFTRIDTTTYERTDLDIISPGYNFYFLGFDIDDSTKNVLTAFYQLDQGGVVMKSYPENGDPVEMTHSQSVKGYYLLQDLFSRTMALLPAKNKNFFLCVDELIIADKENTKNNYMTFPSVILKAFWSDTSSNVMYVVTEDGTISEMHFEEDSVSGFREAIVTGLMGIDHIRVFEVLNGGPINNTESGVFLSVCEDMPNTLLQTKRLSDPEISVPDFQDLLEEDSLGLILSDLRLLPDSTTAMLITNAAPKGDPDVKSTVISFDRQTGKILSSFYGKENLPYYNDDIIPLDAEHYLYQGMIYGFDGDNQLLPLNRLPGSFASYVRLENTQLTDGSILTFYPYDDTRSKSLLFPVWLDGEMVPGSNNVLTGLNFETLDEYWLFENGWILCYGNDIEQVERRDVVSEEKRFSFFDARTGTLVKMPDAHPEAKILFAAGGAASSVFAIGYSNGAITLYYPEDNNSVDLPARYGLNELAGIVFDPEDRYVTVLTVGSKLDIYDRASMDLLFSGVPEQLFEGMTNYTNWDSLRLFCDKTESTLCITTGKTGYYSVLIDTERWVLESEIANVLAADLANKKIYTYDKSWFMNYSFHEYPIHSLMDLKEAAVNNIK